MSVKTVGAYLMSVKTVGGFRKLDPAVLGTAIERSLDTVGIMLEGEVISRANENVDTGRQLHFHRKCGILWKRYPVPQYKVTIEKESRVADFTLINLPLYMISQAKRIVNKLQ